MKPFISPVRLEASCWVSCLKEVNLNTAKNSPPDLMPRTKLSPNAVLNPSMLSALSKSEAGPVSWKSLPRTIGFMTDACARTNVELELNPVDFEKSTLAEADAKP